MLGVWVVAVGSGVGMGVDLGSAESGGGFAVLGGLVRGGMKYEWTVLFYFCAISRGELDRSENAFVIDPI